MASCWRLVMLNFDMPNIFQPACHLAQCRQTAARIGKSALYLQRVEGWAMLAPVRQYDCYISHNGSAAAMTLPTSYNASNPSESSPAGPGTQQQVCF